MTGMLLNNTAYYFGINNEFSYTFDFLTGMNDMVIVVDVLEIIK